MNALLSCSSAPTAGTNRGASEAVNFVKKASTPKRKVSRRVQEVERDELQLPSGPPMPVGQMRALAKDEARRILRAECTWKMDGSGGPDWYLDGLIDWAIKFMYSAEGMPRPGGGQVYEGMDEIEADGHREYDDLRRVISRAIDKATTRIRLKDNAYFVTTNQAIIDVALDKVRAEATKWLEGKPPTGTAWVIIYNLAGLPPGFSLKLPAWTELVESLPDYGLPGGGQTRRAKLLQQLRRVPSFFIPEPWEARHKACISILLDVPTDDQLLGGTRDGYTTAPKSIADVIEAEYRRILNLTNKSQI